MLEQLLRDAAERYREAPFLIDAGGSLSYSEFFTQSRDLASHLAGLEGECIACHMPDSQSLVTLMLAMGMSGKSLLVLNRDFTDAQLDKVLGRYSVDLLVSDETHDVELPCAMSTFSDLCNLSVGTTTNAPTDADGEIRILTSGTTGEPKCARYSWADLFAQVNTSSQAQAARWLLAYRLNHFAGLQMLVHVLTHGSSLVLPESTKVAHALQAIKDYEVTHVSSTPTFWRYALATLARSDADLALTQITLGSEPVSAELLNQLQEAFPGARIVHVYASTEAGSCVSVSDMLPGLPVSILDRGEESPVQFRVVDDELYVRSQHGMRAYAGSDEVLDRDEQGWLATGDLVTIEDGRIMFLGRRSETINVGGVKVHPLEVENRISALSEIELARAYGQENPVVGQIVAVDVVPVEGVSGDEAEKLIREVCTTLGRHARPRVINVVDALETNNLKIKRNT